jgi:hypothetical protein
MTESTTKTLALQHPYPTPAEAKLAVSAWCITQSYHHNDGSCLLVPSVYASDKTRPLDEALQIPSTNEVNLYFTVFMKHWYQVVRVFQLLML